MFFQPLHLAGRESLEKAPSFKAMRVVRRRASYNLETRNLHLPYRRGETVSIGMSLSDIVEPVALDILDVRDSEHSCASLSVTLAVTLGPG